MFFISSKFIGIITSLIPASTAMNMIKNVIFIFTQFKKNMEMQFIIYSKHKSLLLIFCFLFFSAIVSAQFRVIGYAHSVQQFEDINRINFKKLTHLNIAFVNPDATGNLLFPYGFETLIKSAHHFNIKVLASIGGGSSNPYYSTLLNDAKRDSFIKKLTQLCVDYNLEGIDVDLENEAIDSNYEKFVIELSHALKPLDKILTAAVATWNGEQISNRSIQNFNFINIMSYDQTGPWAPEKPGPHSTFEAAQQDLDYWIIKRGVTKSKVNLGVPFYGYCFGTQYGQSMSFKEIIKTFPGSETMDMVIPDTGGAIYYNGILTIQKKTDLAIKKAGGIMIWQLLHDDDDSKYSLLNHIADRIH